MPKIHITAPFNFKSGADIKHYGKGEQTVSQAVADHAIQHGFSPKPKTHKQEDKPADAPKA